MTIARKRFHRPGTSPGTLRPPEKPRLEKVALRLIFYTPDRIEERDLATLEEAFPYRDAPGITWIDVTGLHDVELIRKLGEHFGLHPLALEDVLNTGQRPKLDDYEDHQFIVMKQPHWNDSCELEQVSLFLGKNYVITLQELPGDCFDPIRERLRKGGPRLRKMGPDYLAYAILDAMVDEAFPILERLGETIEDLEEEVIENPSRETVDEIHTVRRSLLALRRATFPEREVINAMLREDARFVRKETRVFLRDAYDHVIQILDMIETYRDLTAALHDVYLSSVSQRLNEIMKVLTIISTIFIPLTFLSGLYGMNFNTEASPWNMPELNWFLGYPFVLGIMLIVALGMLYYFRRKNWI